jgi:hypothetical protein
VVITQSFWSTLNRAGRMSARRWYYIYRGRGYDRHTSRELIHAYIHGMAMARYYDSRVAPD